MSEEQSIVVDVNPDTQYPTHHIALGGHTQIGLILDDPSQPPVPSWVGGERNDFGDGGGEYGEHGPGISEKEWKDYGAGRGIEDFESQPNGFYDSKQAWTMTPGVLMPAPVWHFVGELREEDHYMGAATGHLGRTLSGNVGRTVEWHKLIGSQKCFGRGFTAGSNYTAAEISVFIRRKGDPTAGFTVNLMSDDGNNDPLAVLDSDSITKNDFDEYEAKFQLTEISQAITSSTIYHVVVSADGNDNDENCWEVGCEPTSATNRPTVQDNISTALTGQSWTTSPAKLYFRVCEAQSTTVYRFFNYKGALYAYSYDKAGNSTASKVYLIGSRGVATGGSTTTIVDTAETDWDYYGDENGVLVVIGGAGSGQSTLITDYTSFTNTLDVNQVDEAFAAGSEYVVKRTANWIELTSTGITKRIETVMVEGDYVWFGFGDGLVCRRMQWTSSGYTWAADANSHKADHLIEYTSPSEGRKLMRILNNQTTVMDMPAWGSDLDFPTDAEKIKKLGASWGNVTGHALVGTYLYTFKDTGEIYYMQVDTHRWMKLDAGTEAFPSETTGRGALSWNMQVYWPYGGFSVNRMMGSNIQDIGPWQGAGLPDERKGQTVYLHAAGKYLFAVVSDANNYTQNRQSQILVYEGGGWHEIWRGPSTKRIDSVHWDPVPGYGGRLWWSYGDDIMYMTFPDHTHNPENDSGYQPTEEFHVVSSFFDFGTQKLWKNYRTVSVVSKNLNQTTKNEVYVDIQTDENIGTSNWIHIGVIRESPFGEVIIPYNLGAARMLRVRLRGYQGSKTTPIWIKAIIVEGFTKKPNKLQWTITARIQDDGENLQGGEDYGMQRKFEILRKMAEEDLVVRMTAVDPMMNDIDVIVRPPVPIHNFMDMDSKKKSGRIVLNVRER